MPCAEKEQNKEKQPEKSKFQAETSIRRKEKTDIQVTKLPVSGNVNKEVLF